MNIFRRLFDNMGAAPKGLNDTIRGTVGVVHKFCRRMARPDVRTADDFRNRLGELLEIEWELRSRIKNFKEAAGDFDLLPYYYHGAFELLERLKILFDLLNSYAEKRAVYGFVVDDVAAFESGAHLMECVDAFFGVNWLRPKPASDALENVDSAARAAESEWRGLMEAARRQGSQPSPSPNGTDAVHSSRGRPMANAKIIALVEKIVSATGGIPRILHALKIGETI